MFDIALGLWYSMRELSALPVYFFAAYGASPAGPIKHIEAGFFNGHLFNRSVQKNAPPVKERKPSGSGNYVSVFQPRSFGGRK